MEIVFYCIGSSNCRIFADNLKTAMENLDINKRFEICSDRDKMLKAGVKNYPGLEINGRIEAQGKLLSVSDIEGILKKI